MKLPITSVREEEWNLALELRSCGMSSRHIFGKQCPKESLQTFKDGAFALGRYRVIPGKDGDDRLSFIVRRS